MSESLSGRKVRCPHKFFFLKIFGTNWRLSQAEGGNVLQVSASMYRSKFGDDCPVVLRDEEMCVSETVLRLVVCLRRRWEACRAVVL